MTETSIPEVAEQSRRRGIFFGWYIVAASIATNAIFSASYFQGFGALFLPIESYFGWDRTVLSVATALRQLESGIASPFVGALLDRTSPRKMVVWSGIIAAAGLVGLGLANGIATFYFFFVLVAVGASGVSHVVTWPVLIARWFKRKRGIALGLAVMGPIFGSPFVILNTSLVASYGWRAVFIGYGAVMLVGVTLISSVARDRPEPYGLRPDGDPPEAGTPVKRVSSTVARRADVGVPLRQVLRMKEFWLLTSYLAGMFIVNSSFQVHMFPYFEEDAGLSATTTGVVLTMVFVISGVGRIGSGYLLDKVDYRIVLLVVATMMGASALYLQVAPVHSIWTALPFAVLFGVGFGSLIPMRGALSSMMFGTRSLGAVIGLLQGGAVGAGVVGPIFMGVVYDMNGSYRLAVWGLVAVSAAVLPLALFMASPEKLAERSRAMTSAG